MSTLNITINHYRVFLGLLGAYLFVHFGYLSFFATELFSSSGMLPAGDLSPLWGYVPTLFAVSDSPLFVSIATASGGAAALAMMMGRWTRVSAAWSLFLLISLFVRNPLIANPSMPYLGFMLLTHLFVPELPARGAEIGTKPWRLPAHLFFAASVVLAVSYSYSGYTKLLSPGWLSGDTLHYVLQNPLARDWWLRDFFMLLPEGVLRSVTWFILAVELLYVPLALFRKLRFGLWLGMLLVQFGFLFLLSFPDLTIAMLLFHFLTFDPRWIAAKPFEQRGVLHYDGECGVCHGAIRFALREVRADDSDQANLHFRAMQSDGIVDSEAMQSWRLEAEGVVLEKTNALIRLLQACGGMWRLLGDLLGCVPVKLRDGVYDVVAANRRRLSGAAPPELCPVMAPALRRRFS